MSNYTAELRTIIGNEFDIFDFQYTRSADAQAIISDNDLEDGFINHYYFREVGFETLERFKHKLKTQWLEEIEVFDKLLVAYAQDIDTLSNMGTTIVNDTDTTGSLTGTRVFNDTPDTPVNKPLSEGNLQFATDITENSETTGGTLDSTITTSGKQNITDIEMLELYHDKIKDIITEFYNSFDNLFMQIF